MLVIYRLPEFGFQMFDGFGQSIGQGFKQLPVGLCGPLIPNIELMAVRRDGRPNILTREALAHFPGFAQDGNGTIGLNASNKVNAPRGDR